MPAQPTTALVWFKRDLRLHDHAPQGLFIRRWVSELARVPLPYLAGPCAGAPRFTQERFVTDQERGQA